MKNNIIKETISFEEVAAKMALYQFMNKSIGKDFAGFLALFYVDEYAKVKKQVLSVSSRKNVKKKLFEVEIEVFKPRAEHKSN